MRQEFFDYINSLSLGGFALSTDIPWDSDAQPLYIKNPKRIYVDAAAYENTPLIQTLNGLNINNEITVIRLYFACDAKQLPSNYDTLVNDLKAAKDLTTLGAVQTRQVTVETETQVDLLVTSLEFRFTKLSN